MDKIQHRLRALRGVQPLSNRWQLNHNRSSTNGVTKYLKQRFLSYLVVLLKPLFRKKRSKFYSYIFKFSQQGKTNLSHDGLNPAHVPYQRVNNPNLAEFCFGSIGRADIEESKSNVALNAWLPQASYPYGNYSDTSNLKS